MFGSVERARDGAAPVTARAQYCVAGRSYGRVLRHCLPHRHCSVADRTARDQQAHHRQHRGRGCTPSTGAKPCCGGW